MMLGHAKQTLSIKLDAQFEITTPELVVTRLVSDVGINHLITIAKAFHNQDSF